MPLLEVNNLSLAVTTENGRFKVVEDVFFRLDKGGTLGIVGESGCGKSLTSLAVMGLLPHPQVRVCGGEILFEGENLLELTPRRRREIMGGRLSMIFQEPMTSLNPVYTVGDQIAEAIRQHNKGSRKEIFKRVVELLDMVGIPDPASRAATYPHQLSGGMRQRVMIAMALSCDPILLIADEPTTALDVTVQAQILDLLNSLQERNDMGVMLISHDLGIIAEMTEKTCVMYRGRVVEAAATRDIFVSPRHPYTVGLLKSIPDPDREVERLTAIPGLVPPAGERIAGCAFNPRCRSAGDRCRREQPESRLLGEGHSARCHFPIDSVGKHQAGGPDAE